MRATLKLSGFEMSFLFQDLMGRLIEKWTVPLFSKSVMSLHRQVDRQSYLRSKKFSGN